MFLEKDKKFRIKSVYSSYTVCFLVIAFFSFFWFIVYGKTLIHYHDGYRQYYTYLVYLKEMVEGVFSGEGLSLWSWSFGLGGDVIGNLGSMICNPIFYLAVFFPVKDMDIAFSLIMIVHLYFAGIAMLSFLKYMRKSHLQCLIGGLGYAFSSWGIGVIRHAFFLAPLVIFPLLILGIEKIDREKKPFVFIVSVVFSFLTSLYFSYMSALVAIAYMVAKYFCETEGRSIGFFWKRFFGYVGYVLLAVCITMPIFVISFYTLGNSCKSSGVDIEYFHSAQNVLRYIPSLFSNSEVNWNFSYMMVPVLFISLLPKAIIDFKEKKNRIPFCFLIACLVMAFFPVFGSLFNGFSYSAGRWCYMLAFFMVYALVSTLDEGIDIKEHYKKQYIKILMVQIGIFLLSLIVSKVIFNVLGATDAINGLISLLFIFLFGGLFLYAVEDNKKQKMIVFLFIISTSITFFVDYSPNTSYKLDEYLDAGVCYERYQSSSQKVISSIKDDDFYRVDQMEVAAYDRNGITAGIPANANIYYGTRSIYNYLSTTDQKHYEFNKLLMNSAGYFRRVCIFSNDNRSRMNFLHGVKYYLGDNQNSNIQSSQYAGYGYKKYKIKDGIEILKSKHKPSLGYVYKDVVSKSDFEEAMPLDREQILMQAAVVDDVEMCNGIPKTTTQLRTDTKELKYHFAENDMIDTENKTIQVNSSSQVLTIELDDIAENSELYIEFMGLKRIPMSFEEKKATLINQNVAYDISGKLKTGRFLTSTLTYNPYGDFSVFVSKDNVRKRLINAEGENQAFTDMEGYLANLGYYKIVDGAIHISFSNTGLYNYESINVYAVSQNEFDEQAKALSDNSYHVKVLHDNYVSGTVETKHDGVLYLSVLYNPGWKVYIDGKEQDTYLTNIAFTGVDITAGKHKVELKYRPIMLKESIIISCLGILFLCFVTLIRKQ